PRRLHEGELAGAAEVGGGGGGGVGIRAGGGPGVRRGGARAGLGRRRQQLQRGGVGRSAAGIARVQSIARHGHGARRRGRRLGKRGGRRRSCRRLTGR